MALSTRLTSKHLRHPVWCRTGSSDISVFAQIHRDNEYRCLDDVREPGLIIDCGANVGYAAAWFLSRFPRAKVIAVEPDPENFALLQENVRPYGDRCETLNTAVWSHTAPLVMSEESSGPGSEWGRMVRPARPGERPTMNAVDIGELIRRSGFAHASILKIDIEGAETDVFSSNYQSWLGQVTNLAIELHNDAAKAAFFSAIEGQGFATSRSDELWVCKRPGADSAPSSP